MTKTEHMIWAAVYAKSLDDRQTPQSVITAIENAGWAVISLREAYKNVEEAFGRDNQIFALYLQARGHR